MNTNLQPGDSNQVPPVDLPLRLDYLDHIRRTQPIVEGLRETLSCALALIADLNKKLDSSRRQNQHLRLELRALGEERRAQRQAQEAA